MLKTNKQQEYHYDAFYSHRIYLIPDELPSLYSRSAIHQEIEVGFTCFFRNGLYCIQKIKYQEETKLNCKLLKRILLCFIFNKTSPLQTLWSRSLNGMYQ